MQLREKNMKVYVAGKITGNENFKKDFQKAKEQLEKMIPNVSLLNPSDLPSGMSSADYMRICFSMIDTAEVVFFMKNYVESKGALLERQYCTYIRKKYIDLP